MRILPIIPSSLILIAFTALAPSAYTAEWGLTFGAHDFIVSDINTAAFNYGDDSHTFGLNGGIFAEYLSESEILLKGNADFFLDMDRDKLDPDHLPIWYKIHLFADGAFYRFSPEFGLHWLVDFRIKENTVNGIERDMKQFFGVGVAYDNSNFHFALNGYGGFYYLEIDDDVPVQYGYERRDLGNAANAVSLLIESSVRLGQSFQLFGSAQTWSDLENSWLQHQYIVLLRYDSGNWIDQSSLNLKIEHTQYNLDPYYRPELGVPVLPWDNDTLVRAYISIPWEF
jgi:hypothetical protein